jgi:tRNA nucleotidyltransferase (CCA-adding enzyme)
MNSATISLKKLFPEQLHDRIFLVGGSVRDAYRFGGPGKDIDLSAVLTDKEFSDYGFRLVKGKSTAPIWFRHIPETGCIEAGQLEDIKSLTADLLRRDFSINAMALTLTGELIDPLEGSSDLKNGILRACSDTTFTDDPLRIFRAFRFEADGWQMSSETVELIRQNSWIHALTGIPVERFSREMLKALGCSFPELFFKRMLEFGTGSEFLPELFRMSAIPAGPLLHHPEGDMLTHSIEVLQRVAAQTADPLARFCALFHDIGKLATDPTLYPKHHGHDQAGFQLALSFCNRLRLPASYRTALAWVSRLHTTFNLWEELRDTTKLRIADQANKAGIQKVLPLVSNADKPGVLIQARDWGAALQVAGMSAAELGIKSAQLDCIAEKNRKDYILQKRVEYFRRSACQAKPFKNLDIY